MRFADWSSELRNRLVGNPRVRRIAQKIPLIQSIANRNAERLFAMCSGFVHSQVLYFCARTELIETLRERSLTLSELARITGVDEVRLRPLLTAAEALEIVERRSDARYRLGALGAAQCGNDGLRALILHHDALYRDLTDPLELAAQAPSESRLNRYWAYARQPDPDRVDDVSVAPYSSVMAASQRMLAEQIVDLPVFRGQSRYLDVGGGNATLAITIARRWPKLALTVADLPAVADIARDNVARAGLSDRIDIVGLDFFKKPLPTDQDVVSLVRVLHDHDDAEAAALVRAAATAIRPQGTLVVAEPMAGRSDAGRLIDAYFSIYLMAMGQGRPRSMAEITELLEGAGFGPPRRRRGIAPIISTVVTAQQK